MTRRSHFSFRLPFHLSVLPLSGWAETSPSHSLGSFMLRNLVLTPLTCFANALLHFPGFASVLLFLANPKEKSAFFSHSLFKEAFKGLRYCSHIVVEGDVQSVLSIGFSGLLCCLWGAKGRKLGSFLTHFFFSFEPSGMLFEVCAALIEWMVWMWAFGPSHCSWRNVWKEIQHLSKTVG